MSTAFDSIKRGLQEAIEHAEGRAPEVHIHPPEPDCEATHLPFNPTAYAEAASRTVPAFREAYEGMEEEFTALAELLKARQSAS